MSSFALPRIISLTILIFLTGLFFIWPELVRANEKEATPVIKPSPEAIRACQVDIDAIYDRKKEKLDKNIEALIADLTKAKINMVMLQAFSDDDGSGNIRKVYFQTNAAPVKVDIFNYVVDKLKAKDFKVIAWMHTLSCRWLLNDVPQNKIIPLPKEEAGWYVRASPFSEKTLNDLLVLFDDLSKNSNIDGILFQDDLYMNNFEDYSAPGRQAFKEKFGFDLDKRVLEDEKLQDNFTDFKTKALTTLTTKIMERVRKNIPTALSMRNIYSSLITEPESEVWFAQNYVDFLNNYDYVVVMAYPYLEDKGDVDDTFDWMSELIEEAIETAADEVGATGKSKIIFKIQTFDWNKDRSLPDQEIQGYLDMIEKAGLHSAMYPYKPHLKLNN